MKIKNKLFVTALFFLLSLVTSNAAFSQEELSPGYNTDIEETKGDCPLVTRMPNYFIVRDDSKEFDEYKFITQKGLKTVEGVKCSLGYAIKPERTQPSELQIIRNYTNAMSKMGGTLLYDQEYQGNSDSRSGFRVATIKTVRGNKEVWVEIAPYNGGGNYDITVIEKQLMKQEVKSSDLLFQDLTAMGHVPLYINFDFGKANIKPESMLIINDIAEMMKNNPSLNLVIEGHTDNAGTPQSNKVLSEQRSKSVVNSLVQQGVNVKRLTAVGYGQERPIADNRSEAGRFQNRRVELVSRLTP